MSDASAHPRALADTPTSDIAAALRGTGIRLNAGLAAIRVRSDVASLASQLKAVYRHFPFVADAGWADLHVSLMQPRGLRRWVRPQVVFRCDGQQPFEPFPADTALPLLEWGANWLIGRRMNDVLLLHAGVVERDGIALVMPATPGSGKSTLTAALSQRGWRLLSDEFGALDPESGTFRPLLKPVALKNGSIEVIRRFAPEAELGPEFPKTRKGTVVHLAAGAHAVARVHEHARPGMVVLPRWQAGSVTRWEPVPPETVFSALAFNAFNYVVAADAGFRAVVRLANQCLAWQLVYSDLNDALAVIEAAWPQVLERHGAATR